MKLFTQKHFEDESKYCHWYSWNRLTEIVLSNGTVEKRKILLNIWDRMLLYVSPQSILNKAHCILSIDKNTVFSLKCMDRIKAVGQQHLNPLRQNPEGQNHHVEEASTQPFPISELPKTLIPSIYDFIATKEVSTSLSLVSSNPNTETADILINNGFDMQLHQSELLMDVCFSSSVKGLNFLISKKIDISINSQGILTAFDIACLRGYSPLVKALIENGFKPQNLKNIDGDTPLHHIFRATNILKIDSMKEIFKILIDENHADVNAQNNNGDTCLHEIFKYAGTKYNGYKQIIEYFIKEYQPDISIRNNLGETPMDIALSRAQFSQAQFSQAWGEYIAFLKKNYKI